MRALLARPPGWVPPPEPGDTQGDELVPGVVAGPGAAPTHGDLAPTTPPPRAASGRAPGGSTAVALLPVALRTGRLDPGRRGAAALVLAALLAALVAGGVLLRGRPQEVVVPQVLASGSPLPGAPVEPDAGPDGASGAGGRAGPGAASDEVVVSVAGKVVRPGLVRLPVGSRVDDALRAAGGPVAGTSPGLLNLARRLVDGEQVLVGVEPPPGSPAGAPTGSSGAATAGTAAPGAPLDLNAATLADLDALPGIGPVLAQRILDWRAKHTRFASVDQLREVTGIGEAKYQDLKAQVAV